MQQHLEIKRVQNSFGRLTIVLLFAALVALNVTVAAAADTPKILKQVPLNNEIPSLTVAKGPDLQVTDFQVDTLPAGQKDLHGNTHPADRFYFVWIVRNMGNAIAHSSKFKVTYTVLSGSPTGTENLAYEQGIPQLWPNPETVSGAHVVWNSPPFVTPESPVTFRFRAEIDFNDEAEETKENNNVLIKEITVPPGQFKIAPRLDMKKIERRQEIPGIEPLKPVTIQYPKPGQIFTAPARITPVVLGGGKVHYILKQKVKGRWTILKPVATPSLTITEPGSYCLAAAPEDKTAPESKCVAFEVKAKRVQLKPETAPLRTTTPPVRSLE